MPAFHSFVVLAEMRTGSNFLEANLNLFDGITCHGEAFNTSFIGFPDSTECLGVDLKARNRDPSVLLQRIRAAKGLNGFRYFSDHDPRVLDSVLDDSGCAKIVLTRNPLESYISLKIAGKTGQWKLTDISYARSGQVEFDAAEFEAHLDRMQTGQLRITRALQRSGQTAFYLDYDDLQDLEIINGLAKWLGVDARIESLDKELKKQNPAPMDDKVLNFPQMADVLSRIDRFDLGRTPNFEPRRGPKVQGFVAAPEAPLLFMPMQSAPDHAVRGWLAALDGRRTADCQRGFNQKTLRDWRRTHPGHRSFTVLRHPVARAHIAYCEKLLMDGNDSLPNIKASLRQAHDVPVPEGAPQPETDAHYDMGAHRAAFLAFLRFLKGNLAGQSGLRVDPSWASQTSLMQGMVQAGPPDMILREENLLVGLAMLAKQIGRERLPRIAPRGGVLHDRLAAIYDAEIERAAREAYARDYEAFGFGDWGP